MPSVRPRRLHKRRQLAVSDGLQVTATIASTTTTPTGPARATNVAWWGRTLHVCSCVWELSLVGLLCQPQFRVLLSDCVLPLPRSEWTVLCGPARPTHAVLGCQVRLHVRAVSQGVGVLRLEGPMHLYGEMGVPECLARLSRAAAVTATAACATSPSAHAAQCRRSPLGWLRPLRR